MSNPIHNVPGIGNVLGEQFSALAGAILQAHQQRQAEQARAMQAAMQPFQIAHLQAETDQASAGAANERSQIRAREKAQEDAAALQHRLDQMAGPVLRTLGQGHLPGSPEFDDAVARIHGSETDTQLLTVFNNWLKPIMEPYHVAANTGHERAQQRVDTANATLREETNPAQIAANNATHRADAVQQTQRADYLQNTTEGRALGGPAAAGTLGARESAASRVQRADEAGLAFSPRVSRAAWIARRIPQLAGKLDANGNPINAPDAAGSEYTIIRQAHVAEQRVQRPTGTTAPQVVGQMRRQRTMLLNKGYTDPEAKEILRNSGYNIVD